MGRSWECRGCWARFAPAGPWHRSSSVPGLLPDYHCLGAPCRLCPLWPAQPLQRMLSHDSCCSFFCPTVTLEFLDTSLRPHPGLTVLPSSGGAQLYT